MKSGFLIFTFLFVYFSPFTWAQGSYEFQHLNLNDGLSQTSITKIVQDEHGFLWFSTQDGLNRYDGYEFAIFRKEQYPILSDNYIISMDYHQAEHALWLGSIDGTLYTLNTSTGIMRSLSADSLGFAKAGYFRALLSDADTLWLLRYDDGLYRYISTTKSMQKIDDGDDNQLKFGRALLKDASRNLLWIATERGFIGLDTKTNQIYYQENVETSAYLSDNAVLSLTLDSLQQLWVGTNKGLYIYKPEMRSLQPFMYKGKPFDGRVMSLLHDSHQQIWIGTLYDGLYVHNPKTGKSTHYRNDPKNNRSIGSDYINVVFEDATQVVWLATSGHGLSRTNNKPKKMQHFTKSASGLSHSMVRCFYEDENQQLWIGTGGGGLNRFDPKTSSFLPVKKAESGYSPSYDLIWDIASNSTDYLYLGTADGVVRYSRKTGMYKRFVLLNEPMIVVHLRFIDEQHLLAGTLGKGLFLLNVNNGKSEQFIYDEQHKLPFTNNFILTTAQHTDSTSWVGTFGDGLYLWNHRTKVFTSFKEATGITAQLTDLKITALRQEADSVLWVCTSNGLNRVHLTQKTIEYFKEKQGLPNSYIYAIERDSKGYYWLSSNRGLSRLDLSKTGRERIINFSLTDGIQSLEFNTGSSIVHSNGTLYFGGVNGFNCINPQTIVVSLQNPPIIISSYSINNGDPVYFFNKEHQFLELHPHDQSVSFNLATLDFSNPSGHQYAYWLKGFDSDWIFINNRRFVQFTNLAPDTYDFYIKGTNSDGIWGEGKHILTLQVNPPFWKTWWFRSLIIVLMVGSLSYYVHRVQIRKAHLQKLIQQKTAELSKKEELYRMITENVADTILVINANGSYEYASPSLQKLLGYTEQELYQAQQFEWVHPDDLPFVEASVAQALHNKETVQVEFRLKHKDGSYKIISANSNLVGQPDDPNRKVIAVLRDITAIRMYEDALIKSRQEAIEANKAKSLFLAGMSHELRTPLNAILGFAQILQHDEDIPRRKREFIQTMYKSGNHLLRMINDVLDFSKIEAGKQEIKLSTFDLMSMAYELESMFSLESQNKKLIFDFDFDTSTPRFIVSDPAKLQQILINLIGNAIKFTDSGMVSFRIRADSFEDDQRCVIWFDVTDTGIGIDEEHQATIFDPFHQVGQTGKQGTGLGLSISKKLAELLGGELTLKSKPGKGSTFTLRLPVKYEYVMDLDEHHNGEKWHYEGLRILVVDDIQTNREMAREMLQQYNMQVKVADGGKSCLELIAQHDFDVILMDYLMPEMNGKEVLDAIKQLEDKKHVPVIALTAFGLDKSGEDFLEMGFDGYLSKPLSQKELLKQIAAAANLNHETGTNPIETLKELDIQVVAAEILSLDEEIRAKWLDAIEVLDMENIRELLTISNLTNDVRDEIEKELLNTNYRFFISLGELLI